MFLIKFKSTGVLPIVGVMTTKNKKSPILRCTLMGIERNYRIRILSERLYKKERRFYSTLDNIKNAGINPWFLTGEFFLLIFIFKFSYFINLIYYKIKIIKKILDGEGCFRISLTKINRAIGWRVQLFFQINLHVKDRALLENIKDYLGVGKIHISGNNLIQYRVQTFDELTIIIKHMETYHLITQKRADFELF